MDRIRVIAETRSFGQTKMLGILKEKDGSLFIAKDFIWEDITNNIFHPDNSLIIDDTCGQDLIDSLWRCGYRPTQSKGSSGQLSAVNSHLLDMKKLVGKAYKIDDF